MLPFRVAARYFGIVLSIGAILSSSKHAHSQAAAIPSHTHSFTASGKQFMLDGKPFQIISGEMHYPRIPREYWRDRFKKAKAMGLNTITTYVFWNVHEPRPGIYDFSGQNDIAEYIREAQAEGLHVILRPGPYICAEWELGGYPSWLLKDHDLSLRSDEPKYNSAVKTWFARLGREITPLLLKNGGPILAVQVENEYGSFGDDKLYLENVKQQLIDAGIDGTLLFTSNPPNDLTKGSLPDLPTVINFGAGDAERSFAQLAELRPNGPRMSGEYWAGWFDHWGAKHYQSDSAKEVAEYRWMLQRGYSVNIYMFHGGTSFGWMNGANSDGKDYKPDTTSYDYNAPLDEKGEPREKFYGFRQAIVDATGSKPPPLPKPTTRKTFQVARETLRASLWRNLPTPKTSKTLLSFEDLDQAYGYVLYRTGIDEGKGGKLVLNGLHDYAQVYVDQRLVGILDRRIGTNTLEIPQQTHAATLDILVENTGRANFTSVIRSERKGLTGTVTLDGKQPQNWEIYSLPMDNLSQLRFLAEPCTGLCFLRSTIVAETPADTYLDTSKVHKGMAWINDRPLGRFWTIGPQYTLYIPGPWLKAGRNDVVTLDLLADSNDRLKTTRDPIFGAATTTRE